MMHNNAHVAAVDLFGHNDVVFQKTLAVTDWYADGGDGHPLGSLQTIGKVQGVMMKSWATRVPLAVLDAVARRSVEWLVMAEDLPDPANRVTLTAAGGIRTTRVARGTRQHRLLHRRAKRLHPRRRLRRGRDPVVRHQHEQPHVRHRGCRASTHGRASWMGTARRTT